jgi:hypothetical protein
MSTDSDPDDDQTQAYSVSELRAMDEQTARQTLTVDQYERWDSLQDLYDQAEANRDRFAREDEQVHGLTVHADPEALGTDVQLYGNDLLVHLDSDDPTFRAVHDEYQDLVGDVDDADLDALKENREAVANAIIELFDCLLVRWNGTDWERLSPEQRRGVLADAREAWGFDALVLGWGEVMAAIRETREQQAEAVESFRGETGRRNH